MMRALSLPIKWRDTGRTSNLVFSGLLQLEIGSTHLVLFS